MNVSEMIPAASRAAELMRSLSHPQRLLVLCALGREEKSVAELRQQLGIDQVPMSQQLMRLRADGLVEARREGTTVYYRITRPEVLSVVEALHAAFCKPAQGTSRSATSRRLGGAGVAAGHARGAKLSPHSGAASCSPRQNSSGDRGHVRNAEPEASLYRSCAGAEACDT